MKQLESLPDQIVASLEVRDRWRRQLAEDTAGLEFIVSDLSRWKPGSTVRVAFLDGDTALHADIEQAISQVADECNLDLDFGRDPATGEYRRWTEADTEYAAEIRVSFDMGGYWSLVGTDSNDPTIGGPGSPVGGGPGQRSLNLDGFATGQAGRLGGHRPPRVPARPGLPPRAPEPARPVRRGVPLGGRRRLPADTERRAASSSRTPRVAGPGSTPTWPARRTTGAGPRSTTTSRPTSPTRS